MKYAVLSTPAMWEASAWQATHAPIVRRSDLRRSGLVSVMARLYFLFLTRRHLKPHALQANHIEELPLDSSASLAVVDAQCGQAFAWGGLAVGAARRRAFWRRAVSSKAFFRPMWMDSSIHRTPPGLVCRTAHNGDAWHAHYARCLSGSSTAALLTRSGLSAAMHRRGAPFPRTRKRGTQTASNYSRGEG